MRSKLGNLAEWFLQRHRASCGVKTARKAVLVRLPRRAVSGTAGRTCSPAGKIEEKFHRG